MGENPLPAVTGQGRRLRHGAGLAEDAGGPGRGVPERRAARRRAIVRPAYRYGSAMWSSPGEAAWLIAAAVMPASKMRGPQRGARLVAGDLRGEAAQRLCA